MDTEKISRFLRVIAYLLCAILLMEVILFAGITVFADSVNLFVYDEFLLNQRIRNIGELGSENGAFVSNWIRFDNQSLLYIQGLNDYTNINVQYRSDAGNSITDSTVLDGNLFVDGDKCYILLEVYGNGDPYGGSFNEVRISKRYFGSTSTPLTINDVEVLKANFTGDFTEDEPTQPTILGLYADFTQGIPNILTNLANILYDENGLTIIGVALCVIGGAGTVFSIIKFILNTLKGGK